MIYAWRHIRGLWPRWTLLPAVPFCFVDAIRGARGELRWDHVAITLLIVVLAYASTATKKLCVGLYPFGLVAVMYDLMHFVQDVGLTTARVHLCDLRQAERQLFGVGQGAARVTLQDWWQAHPSDLLDRLCAIPYGTFVFWCVAFAAFLYVRDFGEMQRFAWGFFALNALGFATYHVYPAAPPWYFHAHGCEVDLLARASEGPNLARVDAWLGFSYFRAMYGRASDVFGAMPSLHVAYPLLVVLQGWRLLGWRGRAASLAFFAWMCFAAVYLDHHWIFDELAGFGYAVGVFYAVRLASTRLRLALA